MKFIITFMLTVMMGSAALAHGGGTDSSGCHVERATGYRHCH
jgi:hypothetical protein